MGFDVCNIVSDDKHFGAFICTICHNLVSLDAVVTSACSHPFCRECLEEWVISRVEKNRSCSCPTCQQDLAPPTKVQVTGTMVFGNFTRIYVQPLAEAQPLAMKVLRLVQVSCGLCDESKGAARWTGDYGNYEQHSNTHELRGISKALAALPGAERVGPIASDEKSRGFRNMLLRSHSLPSGLAAEDATENADPDTGAVGAQESGSRPPRAQRTNSMNKKEIKISANRNAPQSPSRIVFNMPRMAQSISDLNYDHYDVVADLDNDDGPTKLKPLKAFSKPHGPLNNSEENNNNSNGGAEKRAASSSTHDDDDKSLPDFETNATNASSNTNTTVSTITASTAAGGASVPVTPKTQAASLVGGDRKTPLSAASRGQRTPGRAKRLDSGGEMADNLEVSYGNLDWNMSLAGLNMTYGTPKERPQTIETVQEEEEEFKLEFEEEGDSKEGNDEKDLGPTEHDLSNAEALELGDKYKKQANAKFNKGDFGGSRALYSEGLHVMSKIMPVSSEECDLVATLYSNRAVTWFREKKFESCVRDCDKSLEYDPSHEKSYIRKWRALSALGQFGDAVACLEEAQKQIPTSIRITQELTKAQEQREILALVNTMIESGDLKKARETIRPLARSSDNISLLLCAAMADAGLGATDSALEKVNKALKFNPNNVEALELKGYVQFLSGEMEKGCRLLQELYAHNRDNKKVASRMNVCQTTFQTVNKGRALGKKKRHRDAAEHITMALEYDPANLPRRSTLFNMLITERSEEYLMCNQFDSAIKDINSVLEEFPEDVSAWSLKTDIAICMRQPKIIEEELGRLRKEQDWASRNKVISELFRKARFETKLNAADDDLHKLLSDIESGCSERLILESRCGSIGDKAAGRRASRLSSSAADIVAGAQALMSSTTTSANNNTGSQMPSSDRDRKYGSSGNLNGVRGGDDNNKRRKDRNTDHKDRGRDRSRERYVDRHKSADMERRLPAARSRSRSSDGRTPRRRDRERDRALEKKFMASIGDFGGGAISDRPSTKDPKFQERKYSSRRSGQ